MLFRSATGVNRTLSIEILEFLDSVGITRRIGDVRKMAKDRIPILGDSPPCPKPTVLPSATPRETVARVVAEVTRAARAPEVAARMAPLSIDLIVSRPEEMQARVNAERERYARDIRALGIKLD